MRRVIVQGQVWKCSATYKEQIGQADFQQYLAPQKNLESIANSESSPRLSNFLSNMSGLRTIWITGL